MYELRVHSTLPWGNRDVDLVTTDEAEALAEAHRRVGPNRAQITLDIAGGPHRYWANRHICWNDDNTVRDSGWRGWQCAESGWTLERFIGGVTLAELARLADAA